MATQTYKVAAGDSLSKIAKTYGVKIGDITGYKSGDPNRINVGENLTINLGGISAVNNTGAAGKGLTSDQMETASNLPEPTNFLATQKTSSLSDKVSAVAKTVFDSNKIALDNLRKQQTDLTAADIKAEQKKNDKLQGKITDQIGNTDAADALTAVNKKFHVEENIKLFSDIQQKIVAATEALNMGLIYEGSRPARQRLLQGRSASLQKEGLATIGALQGTAAVIQGNINLAKAYADSTITAINDDNTRSLSALQTLLNLSNNNLVTLKSDEKKQVEDRIGAINDEMDRLQTNKDSVLDLMTQYPRAFNSGGVTLLDTKEQALQKMVPFLAADEKIKFDLDIATKRAALAKANGTNDDTANKGLLLDYKSKGMTYDEAIIRFADTLTPEYIAAIYGRKPAGSEFGTTDLYSNFVNPDGTPKPGYEVTLGSDGKPAIKKAADTSGGFWNSVGSFFSKLRS